MIRYVDFITPEARNRFMRSLDLRYDRMRMPELEWISG